MPRRLLCFAIVILLPVAALATAQGPAPESFPGYTQRVWTTRDGLPQNAIQSLLQTRDGFLWIGTTNAGLVRFDGLTFTVFDVANTPELPSNWISSLFESADGTLWIGTAYGLVRHHQGVFAPVLLGGEKPRAFITGLRGDSQGRLWVGTSERLVRREGERWVPIALGTQALRRFFIDRDGTAWVAAVEGLIQWRDGVVKIWTEKDGLPSSLVSALYEDRSGVLWVGTERGLARFDRKRTALHREVRPELGVWIEALFADGEGALWIGGRKRIMSLRRDGSLASVDLESLGSSALVSEIIGDREGHVWFGIDGGLGGLRRLRRQTLSIVAKPKDLRCDNFAPTTQGADGTIWLGTYCRDGGNIVAIRDGRERVYDGPGVVASLLAEPDGTLWVGTASSGLYRLSGDRFMREPLPFESPDVTITVMHRDAQGGLWLGTSRGLFRLYGGRWTAFRQGDGLPGDDVRAIVEDGSRALWIGTGAGLAQYANGRFTNYTAAQGVPPGPVRAIHLDTDGVVWIGTYGGGLARLKDGRVFAYGTQGGVLDTSVHRILDDGKGYFWLSGDRGIRRVSQRELNDVAEGRAHSATAATFDDADGMASAECNGMGQPAGARMRDGTLWFPSQGGVVRVDPDQIGNRMAVQPQPVVESASIGATSWPLDRVISAPPGSSQIELRYTAPAFWRPEHVQFRYRLDGVDSAWNEVDNRRVAHYANLRPGAYTFRVAARNAGGEWSDGTASLALVLQPRWYQRRAIQVGAIFLVLAGGLAGVRWRVTALQRRARDLARIVGERTAEIERQRDEIRTAHDRLAAATSGIEQAHHQMLGVLNQLEIGALVLEPNGTIRYATDLARQLLEGETPIVGRSWIECLPLSEAEQVQVLARFQAPPPSRTRLPVQVTIRGRRYWMAIDVRDEPAPGAGRILYLSDVTEIFGLRTRNEGKETFHEMVGRSTGVQLIFKQIRDVAGTDVTVLIDGETGSGKELVARAIHRAGHRAGKPFVAVNTAGLTESLIASQLFGHRRGSFTGAVSDQIGLFESAGGGTLFLDEIGDIPIGVQASLLRVLQEREITRLGETATRKIDVRFVAATHRDLAREVAEGRMRQDLFYRIRVVTIKVPPLRDRVDDMPLLVEKFLADTTVSTGKDIRGLARDAMDALLVYSWPGNVRELKSAIEHAVLRSTGPVVRLEDFPSDITRDAAAASAAPVDASDRERLIDALRRAGGNRTEAARLLGIGRATLYRKLALYGLADR